MAARCGGRGLPARSRGSACCRLRRVKGARPAQPDALAALDPTPAAGDDQRQVAGARKAHLGVVLKDVRQARARKDL